MAVAEEAVVGEVGAAAEEDVEEETCSWKASRSLRKAFDCFRAWLYSEFMVAWGKGTATRSQQRGPRLSSFNCCLQL
jgi:hypothetical protein